MTFIEKNIAPEIGPTIYHFSVGPISGPISFLVLFLVHEYRELRRQSEMDNHLNRNKSSFFQHTKTRNTQVQRLELVFLAQRFEVGN